MEVLDDKAAPIEEVCVESEEEEKMKEVKDSLEESDEDLYKGSRIVQRPPPTVSNTKKCARNGLITWWIEKKS